MAQAKKMSRMVGKADHQALAAQDRIDYNSTRGFDGEPNPEQKVEKKRRDGSIDTIYVTRGPVMGENGMRKGLTPEKYHAMKQKEEFKRAQGSHEKIAPELYEEEVPVYEAFLASGGDVAKKPAKKAVKVEEKVEEKEEEKK